MTGIACGAAAHPASQIEINADEPDIVSCPDCGQPALVEWRTYLESTDGAVEHLKIRCPDRHWFFLPASTVAGREVQPPADLSQPLAAAR